MVIIKETFVFLSQRSTLHQHLRHRDMSLPSRIESCLATVGDLGRCLWSTEPPKAIADHVESVVGAVQVDGGFGVGQKAALHVLSPVIGLYKNKSYTCALCRNPKSSLIDVGGS
jgi:dsRNA-specific ribonuclease